MELSLENLALAKYGNMAKFTKAIGWDKRKTARIISGGQEMRLNDITKLVELLEIPTYLINPLFFGTMFL